MELTMTNNFGFCELNENEMMMIDGGSVLDWAMAAASAYGLAITIVGAIGTTTAACAATCAAVAATPVVLATAIVCGAASLGYGVYCAVNN